MPSKSVMLAERIVDDAQAVEEAVNGQFHLRESWIGMPDEESDELITMLE